MAKELDIAYSGLGPFNAQRLIVLFHQIAVFEETFRCLGISKICLHLYDAQGEEEVGRGVSFGTRSGGVLNTGVLAHLNPMDSSSSKGACFMPFMDIKAIAENDLSGNPQHYINLMKSTSAVGYALILAARRPNDNFDLSKAFCVRSLWGELKNEQFHGALDMARKHLRILDIVLHCNRQITDTKLSTPHKPCVVYSAGHRTTETSHHDMVFSAHGTPSVPLTSSAVNTLVFDADANPGDIRIFLSSRGLLDRDNKLKQGSRVGIVGTSLSAFDMAFGLLENTMLLVVNERPPFDVQLNAQQLTKSRASIAFISRSADTTALPRTGFSGNWTGRTFPYGSTRELHACFLQKDFPLLRCWLFLAECNIAYELEILPKNVRKRSSDVGRQMEEFYRENCTALEFIKRGDWQGASRNRWGLFRECMMAMAHGDGFTKNLEHDKSDIETFAPLTRAGRSGVMFRGALSADPGAERNFGTPCAKEHSKIWGSVIWQQAFSAAPITGHQLIARLFHSQVAQWVQGDASEARLSAGRTKIEIGQNSFDALLCPRILDIRGDPWYASMKKKVSCVNGQPIMFKRRCFRANNGQATNVTDASLGGEGRRAGGVRVNAKWNDTGDDGSGNMRAATNARTDLLCMLLKANGEGNPLHKLSKLYCQHCLPREEDYAKEVGKFSSIFETFVTRYNFLLLAVARAGDNVEQFKAYFRGAQNPSYMQSKLQQWQREVASHNVTLLKATFRPVRRDAYYNRFVDYTRNDLETLTHVVQDICRS